MSVVIEIAIVSVWWKCCGGTFYHQLSRVTSERRWWWLISIITIQCQHKKIQWDILAGAARKLTPRGFLTLSIWTKVCTTQSHSFSSFGLIWVLLTKHSPVLAIPMRVPTSAHVARLSSLPVPPQTVTLALMSPSQVQCWVFCPNVSHTNIFTLFVYSVKKQTRKVFTPPHSHSTHVVIYHFPKTTASNSLDNFLYIYLLLGKRQARRKILNIPERSIKASSDQISFYKY